MITSEKSYIHVLRYLFDRGGETEIKNYILGFNENDDNFDIFVQKLQELARNNDIDIIEEMINDETLLDWSHKDLEFEDDDQEYESYLYGDDDKFDDLNEQIPEKSDEDDELSRENLEKDVTEQGTDFIEEIAGKLGIEDLSK
jgi:hypothetical protein